MCWIQSFHDFLTANDSTEKLLTQLGFELDVHLGTPVGSTTLSSHCEWCGHYFKPRYLRYSRNDLMLSWGLTVYTVSILFQNHSSEKHYGTCSSVRKSWNFLFMFLWQSFQLSTFQIRRLNQSNDCEGNHSVSRLGWVVLQTGFVGKSECHNVM